MLEARRGGWWDANKIGLCSPPIETAKGWLVLYHGVRHTASGSIYRLGLALFDLDKPDVCLQRGDSWIFGPEAPYERGGDVSDVVFPCGQTIGADGDTIFLYYGAADSCMAWLRVASALFLRGWIHIAVQQVHGKSNGNANSVLAQLATSDPLDTPRVSPLYLGRIPHRGAGFSR